ncbi:LON peptidase substrate-binding domain-containing protein [Lewinella sp. IMCC34191]|uniref:LON peptidase substrate-binding domain-containing protein n=1 Tax=Lewinella sp. IMCC34191 TaxID=2259172 RepID=UPI000E23EF32|nr:LON peptidase substrate-binding domain-containing protein [Lewinella sp. IMCC34191]
MQTLALFPLQLVVYPGESLNLHIFEPRYRQLVTDAENEGIRFGVPTVIDGQLQPIATEVSLEEVVKRYPSGESDIRTTGTRVFRIENFQREGPDKLYPSGQVEFLDPEHEEENVQLNREIVRLTRQIYRRLNIDRAIRPAEAGFQTYEICHYVGLTLEQEYALLTLQSAEKRQAYLLNHLKKIKPQLGDPLGIRERAQLNGHFKDLLPPDF